MELAKRDIDWLGEIVQLKEQAPCIEDLLMGKPVPGTTLVEQLDKLAELIELDADQLWAMCIAPQLR